MRFIAYRIGVGIFACGLLSAAGMAPAGADPVTLPPMTSTGSGPTIGVAGASSQMSQQLKSLSDPNVQEVDGSDAAQFIAAAANVTNRDLASPFMAIQRALSCQQNNAGFGARAYRRNDGQWGGAMLVAAKSTTKDLDGLNNCAKTNWRRPGAGSQTSLCNSGWTTPNSFASRNGAEAYYIFLAGTADDFCTDLNGKYKTNASGWPC